MPTRWTATINAWWGAAVRFRAERVLRARRHKLLRRSSGSARALGALILASPDHVRPPQQSCGQVATTSGVSGRWCARRHSAQVRLRARAGIPRLFDHAAPVGANRARRELMERLQAAVAAEQRPASAEALGACRGFVDARRGAQEAPVSGEDRGGISSSRGSIDSHPARRASFRRERDRAGLDPRAG